MLGGATLEVADAGCYSRGATIRPSTTNSRVFHVIDTVSATVRIDQLLPDGEQLYVFEGLARGYEGESAVATAKTLMKKIQASVSRSCLYREEGDTLWAEGGSYVSVGPAGSTILSLKGLPSVFEVAVPVTQEILRPFDPSYDSGTLSKSLVAITAISCRGRMSEWNILTGATFGAPWRLALRLGVQSAS